MGPHAPTVDEVRVSPDMAMRHSAWWAAVNLIARLASTMPWHAHVHTDDDIHERVPEDPQILAAPSMTQKPAQWRYSLFWSVLTRGNVFGVVTEFDDATFLPSRIELLHPDEVSVWQRPDRSYDFRVLGTPVERWPVGPLWHMAALQPPGSIVGMSPVSQAAQAIGVGLQAERFGAEWFEEGTHPSGILQTETAVDSETAGEMKRRFRAAQQGREIAVLGLGIDYKPIRISPEESQFLQTIKANIATIARFFNMPPEILGAESGGSMTYSNVESRNIDLLTQCVGPWVSWLEDELGALVPGAQFVRANVKKVLRLDAMTSARVREVELRNGVMSRNEWRKLDDRPPIEGGDQYLWPPGRQTVIEADISGLVNGGDPNGS